MILVPPPAPIVVEALPGYTISSALSVDGRLAATLAKDGRLDLWSVDRAGAVRILYEIATPPWPEWSGGAGRLADVAGTGALVAVRRPAGGYDVRRTSDGAVVRRLDVPDAPWSWNVAWDPSGRRLLVEFRRKGGMLTTTRVVDLATGRARDLPIAPPWAFTPDGRAVVGRESAGLALVDLATGRVRRRFLDASESRAPYAFSPDGRLLASSGEDPDWHGPKEAFPGDVPTEAAYAHYGKIKVWRVADGWRLRMVRGTFYDNPERFAFLDRRHLAIPTLGEVLDVPTGRMVRGRVGDLPFGTLFLPPLPSAPFRECPVRFPEAPALGRLLAVSSDGRRLVAPEFDPDRLRGATRLLVWDLSARRLLRRLSVPGVRNLVGLGFGADGRLLLRGAGQAPDIALDVDTGARTPARETVAPAGYSVAPSLATRDGRHLAWTAQGLELRGGGAVLARLGEQDEPFGLGLAALPDGGFAVVRQGVDLRLLDRDGRLRATLVAFKGSGWAAWNPAGRAWGSFDGLPRLRRRGGGRLLPLASAGRGRRNGRSWQTG